MRKSELDKIEERSKKRGRPKKAEGGESAQAGGGESAQAGGSGEEAASKEKPSRRRKSKAEKEAEEEEKEKEAAKGARRALRHAVKKVVKMKCGSLALKLMEETEMGNMRSAAMMISLMEKKQEGDGEKRHGGLTAADLLGSEQEWDGETAEAGEKQGTGTGAQD